MKTLKTLLAAAPRCRSPPSRTPALARRGSGPGRLCRGAERQARHAGADGDGLRPGPGLGALSSSSEVEACGGVFETRDPNWSVEAGAQAITDAISSDTKPDVLIVHSPDLNSYAKLLKKAQDAGIYVHPDRQPGQLRRRRLYRQRLGPARPARGRSRRQGLRRRTRRRRSASCRATRSTRRASTSMPAS